MVSFRVTYEIITPESAENGEAESCGFVTPGDWHFTIEEARDAGAEIEMTLRDAMRLANPSEDCGTWFAEGSPDRIRYDDGASEYRSIHPPRNITPASYKRIKRLLKIRN
jgi:hypothetical protein